MKSKIKHLSFCEIFKITKITRLPDYLNTILQPPLLHHQQLDLGCYVSSSLRAKMIKKWSLQDQDQLEYLLQLKLPQVDVLQPLTEPLGHLQWKEVNLSERSTLERCQLW